MKRIAVIFFFVIALLSRTPVALAAPKTPPPPTPAPAQTSGSSQEDWTLTDFIKCMKAAITQQEMCGPAWTAMAQNSAMQNMTKLILGPVPGVTIAYDETDERYIRQLAAGSAVGTAQRYIAMIYATPPANFGTWLADTGKSLGFYHPVYAQGIGFSGLAGLLPIWKAFRNISYLILAVVMIVIGFMIMFRKKIDPKTVVTVQNSIPRIVLTLLLITFSYAIVGIMIDLMYLTILLVVAVFKSTNMLPDPSWISKAFGLSTPEALYTQGSSIQNIWNLFGPINFGITNTPLMIKTGLMDTTELVNLVIFGDAAGAASGITTLAAIGGLLLAIPSGGAGFVVASVAAAPLIIGLLLGIGILFLIIRLFIFFLSNYIQVILALLFAPLQILMEAVPGTNAFAGWLNNLFANIVVFPIGAAIFMLSAVFGKFALEDSGTIWHAPYVPLINSSAKGVAALLALGVLFSIPSVAGAVKEALKPKPFIPAGPEGIVGIFGQPTQLALHLYQLWVSHRTMESFRGLTGLKSGGSSGGHEGG